MMSVYKNVGGYMKVRLPKECRKFSPSETRKMLSFAAEADL